MANESGPPPPPGGYPLSPGDYAPPPPPEGTPPGPPAPEAGPLSSGVGTVRAGVIVEQNPVVVVLLTLVTCGIYSGYWLYRTTRELRDALGDETLKPGIDLLLSVVTCGIWQIYAQYRNAQLLYRAQRRFDPAVRDQAMPVLLLNLAAIVVAFTWFIAIYILQDEQNRLGRLAEGRR
jgi:uncharacterized protein DUF4234